MTDPVHQRLVTQWLREQAAQMRYSQNPSGYIIAEEWAELLEAHAALLASPPPDEPPHSPMCRVHRLHRKPCPLCCTPDEPEAHPKRFYTREEVLSLGVDETELDNMTKEQT